MVDVRQVRAVALGLPRTQEHLIRDRIKFRVGRIVYVAISADGTTMGLAFPREERDGLIASDPGTFFLPIPSELRFHWVESYLSELEPDEMTELVVEAWRMVVPRRVAREHLGE